MTISSEEIKKEAQLLDRAELEATQIRQTTGVYPDLSIDQAYEIQNAWLDFRLARGETLVGHKIGLTSRAMQEAMKISTPDSGFLTDVMLFDSGSCLEASSFCDPKVEVELAFRLSSDLSGPDLGVDDVLDATEQVIPAIELIAARSFRSDPLTGRPRTVVDTIADNAADAGIVLGAEAMSPRALDLEWECAVARRNGTVEETGVAAGVLGHPANGVAWLARRYFEQGLQLEAGQIVLAGSFTRPIAVRPGDSFVFDYSSLGQIELSFS